MENFHVPKMYNPPPPPAKRLKCFKHEGKGHYIGSCAIVFAGSQKDAEEIIRIKLNDSGLSDEKLDIEEIEVTYPQVIYLHNGDY